MPAKRLYVFDACAVVAFLHDEAGAERVQELLDNGENRCLIHAINACEVYRRAGHSGHRRSSRARLHS